MVVGRQVVPRVNVEAGFCLTATARMSVPLTMRLTKTGEREKKSLKSNIEHLAQQAKEPTCSQDNETLAPDSLATQHGKTHLSVLKINEI